VISSAVTVNTVLAALNDLLCVLPLVLCAAHLLVAVCSCDNSSDTGSSKHTAAMAQIAAVIVSTAVDVLLSSVKYA
jgi:hypothetical protein